jgi:environmental stress-induced protein Ves
MKILRVSDYRKMAWKNGKGATSEIAIDPPDAEFPDEDFNWRLSSAVLSEDGAFSKFPGYCRLLWIWKGSGMVLNGKKLSLLQGVEFLGDEHMEAKLSEGPVTDLGLIFQDDRVEVESDVVRVAAAETKTVSLLEGTNFFFCAKGRVDCAGARLVEGETVIETGPKKFSITASSESILIHLAISRED